MDAARGTPAQRGYGPAHRLERERLAVLVAAGGVACARCGKPIEPDEPWDLGHTDDRTAWTGPEHASCNRAAAARKKNGSAMVSRQRRTRSALPESIGGYTAVFGLRSRRRVSTLFCHPAG